MTPAGHIGASLLAAECINRTVWKGRQPPVSLFLAALVGLLPDVDGLLVFLFPRLQTILYQGVSAVDWLPGASLLPHHQFLTHTPLFFILAGLVALVLGWRFGLWFAVLTLLHLLLDSWSSDNGIMWLWPFSSRQFGLFPLNLHAGGVFGLSYYRLYFRTPGFVLAELLLFSGGMMVLARTARARSKTEK